MSHPWTLFMHAYSYAGPVLMLLYPLYASVMTIESSKTGDDRSKVKKERDDEQWLAYWILYFFLYGSFFLGGSLAMSHLWTFLTLPRSIARSALMLLYPLYPSAKTIEKSKKASAKKEEKSKTDNKQWLAYWIIYSFLTLLEMLLDRLLERIPIWYDAKLILIAGLVLPPFNGAAFLYDTFVGKPLRKRRSKPSSPNGKSSKK